jgi:hypothetical protein
MLRHKLLHDMQYMACIMIHMKPVWQPVMHEVPATHDISYK